MSRRVVEVRIEELALEGVRPVDRERVAEAASRELTRLLEASHGWVGGPTAVDVEVGQLAGSGKSPDSLGADVAHAVHERLVR
jgi:hypothetical protein